MRLLLTCALLLLVSASLRAADFPEKWLYVGTNFDADEKIDQQIKLLDQAKKAGVTHVAITEGYTSRLNAVDDAYFKRVQRYLAAAKERQIAIVPSVYPIGYGSGYLWHDANLAAGIPARNVLFLVKDRAAAPDPSGEIAVPNGGFEQADGDKLAGWQQQDAPGEKSFVDKEIKHSGNSSLRLIAKGNARVAHTFQVKPFHYYRLSVWTKSQDLQANQEGYVSATSSGGQRRNIYANLGVRPTEDWTLHEMTFNTFEGTELRFSIGVNSGSKGTLWIDDLKIEQAGLLHVLQSEIKPLVVTSEDGKTVYEQGKDYKPVVDPSVAKKPFAGFRFDHDAPKIELTENSRIKEGDKLLVSYFHPGRIYASQVVASIQEPKTFALMEQQMQLMAKHWPCPGYFMKQDEVRVGGWELQPQGQKMTTGQLLAHQTKIGYELIKKYAPQAKVYAWSDMYTPFHNAKPFATAGHYYLTNGSWEGAWEGLPKDVIVMNWHSPDERNIKWFADRGHQQVLCGYYDGKGTDNMKKNLARWLKVSEGSPGILGVMYTTWYDNYQDLPEFFQLLADYPKWAEGVKTTEPVRDY